MKKKIVTIVGARPQFIKTAFLSWELRKYFKEVVVHTGQHYDPNMSDIFYKDLNLPPVDYNLEVGSDSQGKQTGLMLEKIEQVLIKEKPDLVLIYGDTNSTVAGALAASKLHIPVGHIEAGMRSFNRQMPEEINRVVADHLSSLLFCTSKSVIKLLKKEGIKDGVFLVGDVMNDLQLKAESLKRKAQSNIFENYKIEPKNYLLATIHRQENTDIKENLTNIVEAFGQIKDIIVWPIHPRTKKYIEKYKLKLPSNIKIIEPVGYREMICLETNAKMILTDSGGVQKEAYIARVPCITLRNETEWTQTVESGWNQLVGTDIKKILKLIKNFPKPLKHPNFLGNGNAYLKITQIVKDYFKRLNAPSACRGDENL